MALRTSLVAQPHLYMGDTQGRPLDAGKVYFGEPNKDPELYPINVFYDEALTIAAPQPIRTMGGFMNANGQMTEVYAAETTYSVKVLDGYGRQVFYQASMTSENAELQAVKFDTGITATAKSGGIVERTQADKNAEYITIKDFGAVGDGIADDSEAFINAGQTTGVVVINTGTYKVNGTIPTNCKFIGQGDVTINLTVNGTQGDKGFWIKTGGGIAGVTIRREVIGSGVDGSINNAILIGDYYNPTGIETKNWFVRDVVLEGILEAPSGLGRRNIFGILGNVHSGVIENIEVKGYVTTGLQLHWGGEFDPDDPHKSIVTKSWHPHNIVIDRFRVHSIAPDYGIYGILLSAVHDVELTNFSCTGVNMPLGIGVGDIGGAVAQGASKGNILKNIVVRNFTATDFQDAAMIVWGRSGTRINGEERWFATDYGCNLVFENFKAFRGAASIASVVDIWYMSDITMKDIYFDHAEGMQANNTDPALLIRYSHNINIQGRIVAPHATYIHTVRDCVLDIKEECLNRNYAAANIGTRMTSYSSARTLSKAVSVGDTTVEINEMGSDVYEGGVVTIGGEVMRITKSTIHYFSGLSVLHIEPSKTAAAIGSSVTITTPNSNNKLLGQSRGFTTGIHIEDSFGGKSETTTVTRKFLDSGVFDIQASGVKSLYVQNCSFSHGAAALSSARENIRILGASDDVQITDSTFERNANNLTNILNNIYLHSTVTNPTVCGNYFHSANTAAIRYLQGASKSNIYGNKYGSGVLRPLGVVGVVASMTVGSNQIGYNNAVPSYGSWIAGDVIYNSSPASGGYVGWVCVTSGASTSATWKGFGLIQS